MRNYLILSIVLHNIRVLKMLKSCDGLRFVGASGGKELRHGNREFVNKAGYVTCRRVYSIRIKPSMFEK